MASMGTRILPTRGFLLILKSRAKIIKEGYELLSMKREELVRNLQNLVNELGKIRTKTERIYEEIQEKLKELLVTFGPEKIEAYVSMMNDLIEISTLHKSIMGVRYVELKIERIPEFKDKIHPILLPIARKFQTFIEELIKLAEMETKIESIARDLERTNKIVNALENVVIPDLERDIKYIEDMLEEDDLEEFVRLKFARDKILKRRSSV
ncbi:MAG: V-type ATP synthase subunit D [Candidatus Njordarchaeum guaymaensis]|mgnify:CR=1 FL=1